MIRVGVIRGGVSEKFEKSLSSGSYVLSNLPKDSFEPVDVFIDREGVWHIAGKPISSDKLKHSIDIAWNALNGFYGEDGKVLQMLNNLGIPHFGPDPLSAALTSNRKLLIDHLLKNNIPAPNGIYIPDWESGSAPQYAKIIYQNFSPPWVVQSVSKEWPEIKVLCKTYEDLISTLEMMKENGIPTFAEPETFGKRIHVANIPGFRGVGNYTLIPSSVQKMSRVICEKAEEIARNVHKNLSLKNFSLVSMIVTNNGRVIVENVETVPVFHEESFIHDALKNVGSNFEELARHLLSK